MRLIKINVKDGRTFYGQMMSCSEQLRPPKSLANRKYVSIVLNEEIQIGDKSFNTFTFSSTSGCVLIGDAETDLLQVDRTDMARLDEFVVLSQFHSQR